MNTFIKMLVAITDPVAIERGYQILSAKRDLLDCHSGEAETSTHSYMEPKTLKRMTSMANPADTAAVVNHKLAPSLKDTMLYDSRKGAFMLRLRGVTGGMVQSGFSNGDLFKLVSMGYERSQVRSFGQNKPAIIKNQYLESVFRFNCGCINHCMCGRISKQF